MVKVNVQMWSEQLRQAASDLRLHVDTTQIMPPDKMIPASVHLYVRRYSKVKLDNFESFRTGTVLSLEFVTREGAHRSPSLEQFTKLLDCTGKWYGLSPWGNKFGFGRFDLLETQNIDTNEPLDTIRTESPPTADPGSAASEKPATIPAAGA